MPSIRSTTPFVGSIAWASRYGWFTARVEDPGYLLEPVAVAAQLGSRREQLPKCRWRGGDAATARGVDHQGQVQQYPPIPPPPGSCNGSCNEIQSTGVLRGTSRGSDCKRS